ncbi:hypothetical protein [Rubellimicrobium aerolatum]|uniref:Helix-turn-helix domain-containing protein n=1 Tax=Rubellimicrobium aerolatum TaxID=490979 RepID=A0ABW0SA94_9RHOB|nr:hypothetical protein [Rubellimicrobium aerolatum]
MTGRPRRNRGPAFEAKVALPAVTGEGALAELARQPDVRPNQITQRREGAPAVDVTTLHAKLGERTRDTDSLAGALGPRRVRCRAQATIDRDRGLGVSGQAKALGIGWGSVHRVLRWAGGRPTGPISTSRRPSRQR